MENFFLKLLIYLAPMYFANSFAMLFGGKTPLDLGKKFLDGKPILGEGKTFRGFISGVATGTIVGAVLSILLPAETISFGGSFIPLAFLLSLGAITGDIVASFFKRRSDIERGSEVLFLDQLDFVIGGMIFGSIIYAPGFYEVILAGTITLVVHKASNIIAYRLKLKKVPW